MSVGARTAALSSGAMEHVGGIVLDGLPRRHLLADQWLRRWRVFSNPEENCPMTDGAIVFRHACKLGCEAIVSKGRDAPYRSGRVRTWIKVKNPASPAMRLSAEAIPVLPENHIRA